MHITIASTTEEAYITLEIPRLLNGHSNSRPKSAENKLHYLDDNNILCKAQVVSECIRSLLA
ncbi:hypothetical protein SISNIDRAFT_448105 [Sistotremastrum niveocremeum HHB9708]|uniref:Uncharacterized protein n=2 Tax=Sistotremastraceae TaxID=3402574 RepID=A0A165ALX7_9AGAM|nr:hypothetical protein SISNIDRAFT_448105 [Sistotremastrum niveocremeum HHB9708]KZT42071.1 hypothetical protein SISSUDRAFT_1041998 [Sistotremastrum suecicum HHB10207 ss-3]